MHFYYNNTILVGINPWQFGEKKSQSFQYLMLYRSSYIHQMPFIFRFKVDIFELPKHTLDQIPNLQQIIKILEF